MNHLDIYWADPQDMPTDSGHPGKITLGALYPYSKRIQLRNVIRGKYVMGRCGNYVFRLPAEEFVTAHEFEHALDLEESDEDVISARVLKRYFDYYRRKGLDHFLTDVRDRAQRYLDSLISKN